MKYWDTSALVPLIVDEPSTPAMRQLASRDRHLCVWMFTGVELLSTLARLGRAAPDFSDLLSVVRADAVELVHACTAITDVAGVRRRAERLVSVHPLSAADSLQLAAALVASGDQPETLEFVTLDHSLARSARLEGFRVVEG